MGCPLHLGNSPLTNGQKPIICCVMSENDELLKEIVAYCKRENIAESTFGFRSVNDGKLVQRLRAGGSVTMRTYRLIRECLDGKVAA